MKRKTKGKKVHSPKNRPLKTGRVKFSKSASQKNTDRLPAKRKSEIIKKWVQPAAVTLRRTEASAPAQPSPSFPTALPFSYNETKLTLLVRDPYWAYGYWDFSGETWNGIENLRRDEPNCRCLLRVHDMDRGGHSDIEADLLVKNRYLHLGLPDTNFEVELGLLDPNGKFHVIARSNRIRTPRDGPSKIVDPEWDSAGFDEIYRLSGGGKTGHGSELFSRIRKP